MSKKSQKEKKKKNKLPNTQKISASYWEASSKFKAAVEKGRRPPENRQVTHNLRRRMGR